MRYYRLEKSVAPLSGALLINNYLYFSIVSWHMRYKNLIIVGTSHIAEQSVREVSEAIEKYDPDIIAIELDEKRLHALLHEQKGRMRLSDIRSVGVSGWLLAAIGGYFERKLGKSVGMKPGIEMLTAVRLAKEKGKKLALIDQDISVTLKKFSKEFRFSEKFRLFTDLIKGIFSGKKEMKKYGLDEFDLQKVPDKKVIERLILSVKKRYPSFYKVLIEDRNKYMAKNLAYIMHNNPKSKIVAVVGAGHGKELLELVKKELKNFKRTR